MSRVLVADDNSNIQKMVALALKDHGIEVVAVGNGEAAIRKFPELKPDLVLADIFMPVRNGYEVCEFLKGDPRTAKVPVVLLVGAFDPFDDREAQRVGADGVLKKPFVPPDPLIEMVTGLLAGLETHKPSSEQEVPVEAPVPVMVNSAAQGAKPFVVEPGPEKSGREEEVAAPSRVEFAPGDQPLAFEELLGSVGKVAEAEPEIPTNTHAGLIEPRAWDGAGEAETPVEEGSGVPAWRRGESLLPKREEAKLPRVMASEETQELDAVAPAEAEPSHADWKPIVPPAWGETTSGVVSSSESPAGDKLKQEKEASYPGFFAGANPFAAETTSGEPAATAESSTSPAEHTPPYPPKAAKLAAGEIVSGHLKEMAEKLFREAGSIWSGTPAPVQEAPTEVATVVPPVKEQVVIAPAPERIPGPSAEAHPTVQSFGVPTMPSPQAIEEVVERVMERLQPQIMEVVRKEILRPVVEALVKRELEKKS